MKSMQDQLQQKNSHSMSANWSHHSLATADVHSQFAHHHQPYHHQYHPPSEQHHPAVPLCRQQNLSPGRHPRSLSGSETDISTSTENLTHEEQYVLRNSTRQEPQGEETLDMEDTGGGGGGPPSLPRRGGSWISATTGLGSSYASMDQSSCKTLIIHNMDHDDDFEDEDDACEAEDDEYGNAGEAHEGGGLRTPSSATRHHRYRSRSNRSGDDASRFGVCPGVSGARHFCRYQPHHLHQHSGQAESGSGGAELQREMPNIPRRHYLDQSEVLKHLLAKENLTVQSHAADVHAAAAFGILETATNVPYGHAPAYVQQAFFGTDFDLSQLPPPPEYPGGSNVRNPSVATVSKMSVASPSSETTDCSTSVTSPSDSSPGFPATPRGRDGPATRVPNVAGLLSRSQPDLSCLGHWEGSGGGYFSPRPRTKGKASPDVPPSLVHQRAHSIKYGFGSSADVDATYEKFDRALVLENRQLKAELEIFVSRLQKFEVDIQKVHHAYEELVKSSQKRENLNQAVRVKFELEVRRLLDLNKELRDQVEATNNDLHLRRSTSDIPSDVGKQELQRRDHYIAQLIQQNKELTAAKERHEIELAAQRATLQEQRTHIDILDSALTNAQANVVKLEEDCRKKQAYVERVAQLQRALTALQVASERREQMERKLRNQLERDLNELRQRHLAQRLSERGGAGAQNGTTEALHLAGGSDPSSPKVNGSAAENSERAVDDLKSAVRQKEERIICLETEKSKWEQRYLEENAMRQMAIDAASMPKDAKIAALERTSQESEKLIAEAHSEKLKQMDELHLSNKRCADMEARMRDLESKLAERDAMIKVLQKHSIDKDAAFHSAMLRSPRHTPHPSFHAISASGSSVRSNNLFSISVATSADDVASASAVVEDRLPTTIPSPDGASSVADAAATRESLDEQLKKLDSQLLSKDSIINALRSEKEKYPSHYWMV